MFFIKKYLTVKAISRKDFAKQHISFTTNPSLTLTENSTKNLASQSF